MKHWIWILPSSLALLFFSPTLASTSLGKKIVLTLVQAKVHAKIEMESLQLSWLGPQRFEKVRFKGKELDGSWDGLIAKMPLWKLKKLRGEWILQEGNFSLHSDLLGSAEIKNVNATLHDHQIAVTGATGGKGFSGTFSLDGTFENYPSTFSLKGNLASFPSAMVDDFFKAKGLFVETVGSSFNLEGSLELAAKQGSLDFQLSSSKVQLKMAGKFDGKNLVLTKPLNANFLLTPTLSDYLTREINPLFLTSVKGQDPISLTLSPEGSNIPYAPFAWKHLTISSGRLNVGRLILRNGPTLRSMMTLLQSARYNETKEMNAWFTPLDFQLAQGKLQIGRVDFLLANSIHLCNWGRVDLTNDQLDMILGLPADTLSKSFGLQGLNANYVLKIPLRGSLKKPDLDTKGAAAQIATMAAAQKLPLPKAGKIFGNIVNKAIQIQSDSDVPPPKRPFPWE